MNQKKVIESMEKAVSSTLANMSFIDAMKSVELPEKTDEECNEFAIEIISPFRGQLTLCLSDELKAVIVENIYGEDISQLKSIQINDSILEILNVITGEFLTDYYEKKKEYRIELPQMVFEDSVRSSVEKHEIGFDAEGLPFKVILNVEEDEK